jgi:membrane-associated phospholipid phosphatase
LTCALAAGAFLDVDLGVRDWCDTHRAEPLRLAARGLNFVGSANLLAPILLGLAGIVGIRRRTARPVLPVLLTLAAGYAVVVPLKMLADRSAPHSAHANAVELFANDSGWSYPSGHVVNAVIWYGLVVVLLDAVLRRPLPDPARRLIRVLPVVIVTATVTYLGFHWLTDAAAGLLLGLALDRVLRRVRWVQRSPRVRDQVLV